MQEYISIVVALANVATAAGILLLWKQFKLMWEQLRLTKEMVSDDHERSRRQFAIETVREWNRSLTPETSAAQKLIAELNKEQCEQIANYKPVKIEKKYQHLVELCFAGSSSSMNFEPDGENICLKDAAVKQIRYLGVDYLNEIETALSAWLKAVGDKKYIEREFKFLDKDVMLRLFRCAFPKEAYPAIDEFLKRDRKEPEKNLGGP